MLVFSEMVLIFIDERQFIVNETKCHLAVLVAKIADFGTRLGLMTRQQIELCYSFLLCIAI